MDLNNVMMSRWEWYGVVYAMFGFWGQETWVGPNFIVNHWNVHPNKKLDLQTLYEDGVWEKKKEGEEVYVQLLLDYLSWS